jgi:hypothetical protein
MTTRPVVFGGGFVSYRGVSGESVAATPVVFHRTGGARIYGDSVHGDSISFAVDSAEGHINLLPMGVFSRDVADLVGDLFVHLPPPYDSSIIRGLHLPASVAFNELPGVQFLRVGPSVRSRIRTVGPAGEPVAGVRVSFAPSSGVGLSGNGLMATSNDSGYATIDPRVADWGTATGDILVDATSRGGRNFTISGVTLTAFDDDSVRTIGSWNVVTGIQAARRP